MNSASLFFQQRPCTFLLLRHRRLLSPHRAWFLLNEGACASACRCMCCVLCAMCEMLSPAPALLGKNLPVNEKCRFGPRCVQIICMLSTLNNDPVNSTEWSVDTGVKPAFPSWLPAAGGWDVFSVGQTSDSIMQRRSIWDACVHMCGTVCVELCVC